MTKKSREKFKYLEKEKRFSDEIKSILKFCLAQRRLGFLKVVVSEGGGGVGNINIIKEVL